MERHREFPAANELRGNFYPPPKCYFAMIQDLDKIAVCRLSPANSNITKLELDVAILLFPCKEL